MPVRATPSRTTWIRTAGACAAGIILMAATCAPPPKPDVADENDFEFTTITIAPALDTLRVGGEATVVLRLYPAYIVERLAFTWASACGDSPVVDMPIDRSGFDDTISTRVPLFCPDTNQLIVTAYLTNGTTAADTQPCFVHAPPPTIADRADRERTVALGSGFDLWVEAAGWQIPDSFTYVWMNDGEIIPNAGDSVFSVSTASTADSGRYVCVVSSAWGSVFSDTFKVHIDLGDAPLIIRTSPVANQVRQGDPVTFWVSAIGTPPLTYTWKHGAATLTGSDSALTINAVAAADSGDYVCIVSNARASANDTFHLAVVSPDAPPAPANLRITALSATTVSLSWDTMTVDSFVVYRKKIADPTYVRIGGADTNMYTDSAAEDGECYHHVVVAYGQGMVSGYSNAVSSQRTPMTPVKDILAARLTVGSDKIAVSWSPMAGATAADGIEYQLVAADTAAGSAFSLKYTGGATSTTVTSSAELSFYVVAVNKYGESSAPSDTVATVMGVELRPAWARDTLRLTINEGDSGSLDLPDSLSNLSWFSPDSLSFRLASPSTCGRIDGSLYRARAGRRQAGQYSDAVIASFGDKADTAVIILTVNAAAFTLTLQAVANGEIAATPSGAVFRWGDTVMIAATPDGGFRLYEWTGDVSGNDSTVTIILTSDKTIGATFISTAFTCTPLTPGPNVSISAQLQAAAASSTKPVWICVGEGLYEENTVGVEGKVDLWVE